METMKGFRIAGAFAGGNVMGGFWLADLDEVGNVVSERYWHFPLGGPLGFRMFKSTADGGIVLGGAGADTYGNPDYWIARLDSSGDVVWERTFGGDQDDNLIGVQEMRDGGILMLGRSDSEPNWSPFGGGDKISPNYGWDDAWVIRLDRNGNKLWEQSYGGIGFDDVRSALETEDGGMLLGCYSTSPASGNKSTAIPGEWHSWFIRVDSLGNKLWERSSAAPGPDIVKGTPDGGWVCAGVTSYFGDLDYGASRMDRNGNVIWEMAVGGTSYDSFMQAAETLDGGLMLVGYSLSDVDGNKTVASNGYYDVWAVKLASEPICDSDGDGVLDDRDLCPDTHPGAVVDTHGCSMRQLVPCDGQWMDHRDYVRRVAHVAKRFCKAELISRKQWFRLVAAASQSDCGREREREELKRRIDKLRKGLTSLGAAP